MATVEPHDCHYAPECRRGQLVDLYWRCPDCVERTGGRVHLMWVVRPAQSNPLRMWEEIAWVPSRAPEGMLL